MTNFDGIFAKIARAGDQASSLKLDIERFCADIRPSIVHEVHEDSNEQVWVFRGTTPNVPIGWSIRLGELFYNMRSALDHLVWQLVLANGQRPGRYNAFPIAKNENDWRKQKKRKRWALKGLSQRSEDTIRCLQPYTGGIGFQFDVSAFSKLHTLCNIDKHRHLILAIVGSYGIDPIVFGHNHPPLQRLSTSPPLEASGSGGKIVKDKVLLCLNSAVQEFKPSFQLDVHFEDMGQSEVTAGTVPDILSECIKAVQGAVEIIGATELSGKHGRMNHAV